MCSLHEGLLAIVIFDENRSIARYRQTFLLAHTKIKEK